MMIALFLLEFVERQRRRRETKIHFSLFFLPKLTRGSKLAPVSEVARHTPHYAKDSPKNKTKSPKTQESGVAPIQDTLEGLIGYSVLVGRIIKYITEKLLKIKNGQRTAQTTSQGTNHWHQWIYWLTSM
jgi:hypothetical protein